MTHRGANIHIHFTTCAQNNGQRAENLVLERGKHEIQPKIRTFSHFFPIILIDICDNILRKLPASLIIMIGWDRRNSVYSFILNEC